MICKYLHYYWLLVKSNLKLSRLVCIQITTVTGNYVNTIKQSAKQCKKGSSKISREFWSLYFSHFTPLAVNIFVHTLHGLYIAANFSPENGWKCLHTLAPRLTGVLGGESSKYAQNRTFKTCFEIGEW